MRALKLTHFEVPLMILLLISLSLNLFFIRKIYFSDIEKVQQSNTSSSVPITSNNQYKIGDRFIGLLPPKISSQVPYYGDYIDIDNDGEGDINFYTVEAMTKPPHVAYIVKDGVIIFRYEGARVSISDRADKPGFVVKEWTLDNFKESSKTSTFSYEKGTINKIHEKLIKLDE